MKVKFVTAIYTDLHGTVFGGRPTRHLHYRFSLLSLLKMTEAYFVCYTSEREYESLCDFFFKEHNVPQEQLNIVVYNLENHNFLDFFQKYKDYESSKNSDRCLEIQYMKFVWSLMDETEHEYVYWIDSGLSHCGLLPNRHLNFDMSGQRKYYETNLFNNTMLNKLVEFTGEKFFLIGKENFRNYWSGTVNEIHYDNYDNSLHIIGGLFGGKKENMSKFCSWFMKYSRRISEYDKIIYHEEDIMKVIFRNNENFFILKHFDSWWHDDERIPGLDINEHIKHNKSFYKILEEFN